jgi:hypothetical protein
VTVGPATPQGANYLQDKWQKFVGFSCINYHLATPGLAATAKQASVYKDRPRALGSGLRLQFTNGLGARAATQDAAFRAVLDHHEAHSSDSRTASLEKA